MALCRSTLPSLDSFHRCRANKLRLLLGEHLASPKPHHSSGVRHGKGRPCVRRGCAGRTGAGRQPEVVVGASVSRSTSWPLTCRAGSRAVDLLRYPTWCRKLPISSSGICTNPSPGPWQPDQRAGLALGSSEGLLHLTLCASPGVLQLPPASCVA